MVQLYEITLPLFDLIYMILLALRDRILLRVCLTTVFPLCLDTNEGLDLVSTRYMLYQTPFTIQLYETVLNNNDMRMLLQVMFLHTFFCIHFGFHPSKTPE